MENLESNETNFVEKNQNTNLKTRSTTGAFSPKVLSILLIINLVIGVFTLIGVGYLSFKYSDSASDSQILLLMHFCNTLFGRSINLLTPSSTTLKINIPTAIKIVISPIVSVSIICITILVTIRKRLYKSTSGFLVLLLYRLIAQV
ncbi:hypothetical protein [Gottfriedia luciferensis]|uniref:hypothetical protein n=1 Tax=Gottfriedia luciferensis TaxID=178774 RepID=UPI000B42FD71|nr:hypothetical protein [Gottfriedia luciferensis]